MIVKDEAAVIERCLASVRGLIGSWVICDTGSTDGTQERVKNALADLPGELYERPWRNFGHNRSELMRLARGKADYLLLLDADMTVSFQGEAPLDLTADSYMLRWRYAGLEYWMKCLVRGDRNWWYEGVVHEYLMTSGPEKLERLNEIVIDHYHAEGESQDDESIRERRRLRMSRDCELLSKELKRDPSNDRTVFYLAQTHRDLGEIDQAIELYERRAAMGGWEEEVFYSLYQVGVLKGEAGDWPEAMVALQQAWEYRSSRLEPLYELTTRLRQRNQYQVGYLFARRGLDLPLPEDSLFLHRWIYDWGLLFEYSICAYWVGETKAALRACERLLAMKELPENIRTQTLINYDFCLKAMGVTRWPTFPRASD